MSDEYLCCYVVAPADGTVEFPLIECDREPGHDGPHTAIIQVSWENVDAH